MASELHEHITSRASFAIVRHEIHCLFNEKMSYFCKDLCYVLTLLLELKFKKAKLACFSELTVKNLSKYRTDTTDMTIFCFNILGIFLIFI